MSQHFQGPFGPLVLTFCGRLPNFEGNCPKGTPYFDPCPKRQDFLKWNAKCNDVHVKQNCMCMVIVIASLLCNALSFLLAKTAPVEERAPPPVNVDSHGVKSLHLFAEMFAQLMMLWFVIYSAHKVTRSCLAIQLFCNHDVVCCILFLLTTTLPATCTFRFLLTG